MISTWNVFCLVVDVALGGILLVLEQPITWVIVALLLLAYC